MLDLRLLGPMRVLVDGSEISLGRVLQQATLAVLALKVRGGRHTSASW